MDGQKKMLIVDDLLLNRTMLKNIFEDEFNIIEAANGVEAMSMIQNLKNEIAIVLLDLQMPLKNGYEVLAEVKSDEKLKDIPVIVTTTCHNIKNEVRVLKLGADDFVNQPVEPEIIRCRVQNMITKKEVEHVKEQNRILEIIKKNEEIYKIIVKQVELLVFEWNIDKGVDYMMEGVSQFAFVERRILIGNQSCQLKVIESYGEDTEKFYRFIELAKLGIDTSELLMRLKKITGEYVWCKLKFNCFYNDKKQLVRIIGALNNVDENIKAQSELVYRAEYDEISDCYNRRAYHLKIEELFIENPEKNFAILRMNIKKFKVINEVYGTRVGNYILKEVGKLIKNSIGMKGICGRNHSDIFGICIVYEEPQDILDFIHLINEDSKRLLSKFKLEYTFGIYQVENKDIPVNQMCDLATLAMKTIKENSFVPYAFYNEEIQKKANEEREMEDEMKEALLRNEFIVYLQPKHKISTGEIIGAEALVRWNHPLKGLIPPNIFIPLFERNGFIIPLDEYVWEETCRLMRRWMSLGYKEIPVSVNVSRMHVYDSEFSEKIISITSKYQIPNELFELELTENAFIENTSILVNIMEAVGKLGFRFSLDDFGTGYSSLSILKDAPISIIKLDREFFNETNNKSESRTIVKYIIEMSKSLGIDIVAEGVENKNISEDLLHMGCNIAQGYYFSKPMPAEEFEQLLFLRQEKLQYMVNG